jgi:hypothetical protein
MKYLKLFEEHEHIEKFEDKEIEELAKKLGSKALIQSIVIQIPNPPEELENCVIECFPKDAPYTHQYQIRNLKDKGIHKETEDPDDIYSYIMLERFKDAGLSYDARKFIENELQMHYDMELAVKRLIEKGPTEKGDVAILGKDEYGLRGVLNLKKKFGL